MEPSPSLLPSLPDVPPQTWSFTSLRGLLQMTFPPLSVRAGGQELISGVSPGEAKPSQLWRVGSLILHHQRTWSLGLPPLAWLEGDLLCQMTLLDRFLQPAWPEVLLASPPLVKLHFILLKSTRTRPSHPCPIPLGQAQAAPSPALTCPRHGPGQQR